MTLLPKHAITKHCTEAADGAFSTWPITYGGSVNVDVLPEKMIPPFYRFMVSLLYSVAVHFLAFWFALLVVFTIGGKSPNVAILLIPIILIAYFAAGWILQRRTDGLQLIHSLLASTLSLLMLPLIVYLDRYGTDVVKPVDWVALLWLLPCITASIAGVYAGRFNQKCGDPPNPPAIP